MLFPPPPSRAELVGQLTDTAIAGRVATPRQNNLEHFELLSRRVPHYLFGMDFAGSWTPAEVLALMVKKVGVDPDETYRAGVDTIDPERTVDALEAMAERLAEAARKRQDVVLATGHPGGMLPVYVEAARTLEAHGARIVRPAAGRSYIADADDGRQHRTIRYICGVATLSSGGALHHTHSPRPMREMLREMRREDSGRPGLVIADHGWAGAAGEVGLDVVGFADCNDPALFVGEAEGKIGVAVPLDDNVDPEHYAPMTSYLLHHAGLL